MNWRCEHSLLGVPWVKILPRRRAHLSLCRSSFVASRRTFALSLGRLSWARRFERFTARSLPSASNSFCAALNSTRISYCHTLIIVTKSKMKRTFLLCLFRVAAAIPSLSLDTPVFLLKGTETVRVNAGDVIVGDMVVGYQRVGRVIGVERRNASHVEVCRVPHDLCGTPERAEGAEGAAHRSTATVSHITPTYAVRCDSWDDQDWAFCDDSWEKISVSDVVNIQLESYFKDTMRTANGALVESWNGAGDGESCGTKHEHCKTGHMWVMKSLSPLRFNRYAIRIE